MQPQRGAHVKTGVCVSNQRLALSQVLDLLDGWNVTPLPA